MSDLDKEHKNWHPLKEDEEEKLKQLLKGGYYNYRILLRYKDTKFAISQNILRIATKVRNFQARSDDIWIMTYPKSGTHWMSEIVWQIENGVKADCDGKSLLTRAFFFDIDLMTFDVNGRNFRSGNLSTAELDHNFNKMDQFKERRIIKTHIPFCLRDAEFLDKTKVIYVARHPKDVCVSYFHYHNMGKVFLAEINKGFEEFAECFKEGLLCYGDYLFHINVSRLLDCC